MHAVRVTLTTVASLAMVAACGTSQAIAVADNIDACRAFAPAVKPLRAMAREAETGGRSGFGINLSASAASDYLRATVLARGEVRAAMERAWNVVEDIESQTDDADTGDVVDVRAEVAQVRRYMTAVALHCRDAGELVDLAI